VTVDACLKKSTLWEHITTLPLSENMRVKTAPNSASAVELAEFSAFLLSIGEGRHEVNEDGEVRLSDDMCIHDVPLTANEEADFPDFRLLRLDDNEDDTEGVSGGQIEDDATKEERNINALVDAVSSGYLPG